MHSQKESIGRWVEAHRLRITDPSREVLMQAPAPGQDLVSEIQMPVEDSA